MSSTCTLILTFSHIPYHQLEQHYNKPAPWQCCSVCLHWRCNDCRRKRPFSGARRARTAYVAAKMRIVRTFPNATLLSAVLFSNAFCRSLSIVTSSWILWSGLCFVRFQLRHHSSDWVVRSSCFDCRRIPLNWIQSCSIVHDVCSVPPTNLCR